MKKLLFAVVCAAAVIITGCTTVESTQKFNRRGLGERGERAVCVTYVEIPGYYIFGLPIVTGSPKGDGQWNMFRYNQTTTNIVYLLTKEAKERKASRVINIQVNKIEVPTLIPFVSKYSLQASGVGIAD